VVQLLLLQLSLPQSVLLLLRALHPWLYRSMELPLERPTERCSRLLS
jgi:hypothetical protein